MDLLERARSLAAAVATGGLAGFVDEATRYRHGATTLDGAAWAQRVRAQAARAAAHGQTFQVTDLVQRRNLVFLGWTWGDGAGTWVLSFDREGRVREWLEA